MQAEPAAEPWIASFFADAKKGRHIVCRVLSPAVCAALATDPMHATMHAIMHAVNRHAKKERSGIGMPKKSGAGSVCDLQC